MIQIHEIAKLLDPHERASGACSLAQSVGATQLCLFIRDPELGKFLPGPGFPQKLPGGIEWQKFLSSIPPTGYRKGRLRSPFASTSGSAAVSGFFLDSSTIAVLFGDGIDPEAVASLVPGLRILATLLAQEVRTQQAQTQAAFSKELAIESRELAKSLSEAHDQLAASFDARESLQLEVRKRDQRLQLARRISGIGVWEYDSATGEVYLAPETAAIYGLPPFEFVGNIDSLRSKIHADDRTRSENEMARTLACAEDYSVQFRVVWPNGIVRWVEERGMVLGGADGRTERTAEHGNECRTEQVSPTVIGYSMDITQRLMTEQALVHSEKLAAAGRLAASIAHEINNPLESLVNLIYLARTEPELDGVRALLATAEHELSRISGVARTSLGFYREGTRVVRFDIVLAVQQTLGFFEKQAHDKGITLKAKWSAEAAEVEGWPGEIKQAVSNLLLNAIHASSPGSTIHIRIHSVRDRIHLVMADSGHGISRDHQARIFEPFFSTKTDSGTGLGLWVTKQIVEKHGGLIAVRSSTARDRHGTVFRLSFPQAGRMEFENADQSLRYRWLRMNG